MAGIDKIYGTQEQYHELKNWIKENRPQALHQIYSEDGYMEGRYRPISNFTEDTNKWLLDNCPIDWVVDRIKYQYGIKD